MKTCPAHTRLHSLAALLLISLTALPASAASSSLKAASPFKNTLVIELCNDDIAYVPTRKAFAEGSYEIVNSRVAPGGGEILVETAARLLKELKSK